MIFGKHTRLLLGGLVVLTIACVGFRSPRARTVSSVRSCLPQAPAPATVVTSRAPSQAFNALVSAHNKYRTLHCARPVAWSPSLAAIAQRWADHLRDRQCTLQHNPATTCGENLTYDSPSGSLSPDEVVRGWYSEVGKYSFWNPRYRPGSGHFTQVVWAATRLIGCGVAHCVNADVWVCNYDPPGNVLGQFADNVSPKSCAAD
jgi:uncharacterized protein YkwD